MSDREVCAHTVAMVRSYDPCMACTTHVFSKTKSFLRIVVADEDRKPLRVLKLYRQK